ncbi:hypothetical protein BC937DRAFT_90583 [Endogone sp. FLAS-F59071]|nr:hypothetical protein BC937DRAFT_90583 [Endogone sp. FLAS-F59071]|eukprot:RUS16976.1 hypothetical protein BC937DRAFT_90583 [Endogone sp. FLAS-F59071]
MPLKVDHKDLTGKVTVVTGANTGIGLETARMLAQMGARVLVGCRSKEKGEQAVTDIIATTGNDKVENWPLNLASFASVRVFAERFGVEYETLDILVNNAGNLFVEKTMTDDGLENSFQVNHLSPFLLTNLLLPYLRRSASPRVINVSSVLHFSGNIDFENLQGEKTYKLKGLEFYTNTKLMNIVFTEELARREKKVITHSLHPGSLSFPPHRPYIPPDIWFRDDRPWYVRYPAGVATLLFARDTVQGAMTTVHCAVSDEAGACNAKYWDSCRVIEPSPIAHDKDIAHKLWEVSERLVGLSREN